MYWPTRSQQEVGERAAKAATVLRGKPVTITATSGITTQFSNAFSDDKLESSYDGDFDTLWVRDRSLALAVTGKSTHDVGEEEARSSMKLAFQDMVTAGLVDSQHYDVGDVQTGHHRVRLGMDGSPVTEEHVVEYRFRMLRKLNGIAVPNNGLVIGIAPSGIRSSIKLGGVQIDSVNNGVEERPKEAAALITRKVAQEAIQLRFERDISPGRRKHLTWNKLMYVMPTGARSAVVEPSMVYHFAPIGTNANGEEYVEPTQLYAFSLFDSNAPAVNLFPSNQ